MIRKRWGAALDRLPAKAGLPLGIGLGAVVGALLLLAPAVIWVPAVLVLFVAGGLLAWSGEPVEVLLEQAPVPPAVEVEPEALLVPPSSVKPTPAVPAGEDEPVEALPVPPPSEEPAPVPPAGKVEPVEDLPARLPRVEPALPAEPVFAFNGINGRTGQPLYQSASLAELDALARSVHRAPGPSPEMTASQDLLVPTRLGRLGLRDDFDPRHLASSGWGVIFPQDVRPEIREALAPLIEHRRQQASALVERRFREFAGKDGYQAPERKSEFLRRFGVGPGPAVPDRFPYYLLLVGSPEEIPWSFQHALDFGYAVGRLFFDTAEEYARYAETVIAAETGRITKPRWLTLFGTRHPGDRATELMADYLISPLADALSSSCPVETFVAGEATKERLARLLGGNETPALLFTALHGVGYPAGDPQQLDRQGALLCQDWPGPGTWKRPLASDFFFAGDDVADGARPAGLIAFFYACHSVGTPWHDAYPERAASGGHERRLLAPRPFAARLPRRLLGHPAGGALAVIGQVERTWGYSFLWEGGGRQTQVFEETLKRLLSGYTVGHALEPFALRLGELAEDLTSVLEAASLNEPVDPKELVRLWTAHNDARTYTLLGDPAVRLPLAQGPTQVP
jgi:hypothetical protein